MSLSRSPAHHCYVDKAVLPATPSQSTARTLNSAQQISGALKRNATWLPQAFEWLHLRTGPWINEELRPSTSAWAKPLVENFWRAVPHLLAATLAWTCLTLTIPFPSDFEEFPSLYHLISWLWSISWLVGLCNLPRLNYPLNCCQAFSD